MIIATRSIHYTKKHLFYALPSFVTSSGYNKKRISILWPLGCQHDAFHCNIIHSQCSSASLYVMNGTSYFTKGFYLTVLWPGGEGSCAYHMLMAECISQITEYLRNETHPPSSNVPPSCRNIDLSDTFCLNSFRI